MNNKPIIITEENKMKCAHLLIDKGFSVDQIQGYFNCHKNTATKLVGLSIIEYTKFVEYACEPFAKKEIVTNIYASLYVLSVMKRKQCLVS